ncbi:MAG: hypothetical protein WC333_00670 [Dehalococcoidia bacterium]|jgi:hypothetical protein
MAIGTYGITRPADVSIEDIDIYYNYIPDRQTLNDDIFKIESPSDMLSYCYLPQSEQRVGYENLLEGLYNLRLPASIFNQLGIYTIYIKPKVLEPIEIKDCGVLSALPTIKGLVVNLNDLPDGLRANNALQGYRIEYINSDNTKLRNVFRYVVTSNKVVAVSENVGNTSQKTQRYRFDDSGSLVFIQLTPSSSSDVKPNSYPFIGTPGQEMLLSNTFFTPLTIEVELVENTLDTIMDVVAGEQIKDVQKGILTYYNKDRAITKQINLYEIKDDTTNVPLFEVKEKRENIDETQNFDDITSEVQ